MRSESERLFLERAMAAAPEFVLGDRHAAAVPEICRRLDGIPLAIELAAARVRVLSPEQIVARLSDRFGLLVGASRTAPIRHRTLRAALEWSYDLLSEHEQPVFDRIAVFAGGWGLEAAEAVCGEPASPPGEVLDELTRLVDKSLVLADPRGREVRYRLLETVREFALDRLAARGETESVRWRHAEFYRALAERAEPELRGVEQASWLARLELEHDNLRAALHWAAEAGAPELALHLAGALWRFWY
jgi:non-specific serine/threonine protein kinase